MADVVLETQCLHRQYGDQVAVECFSATVSRGEVVVLVGPNGCGKTTSVEMAIGLRRSEGGTSRIAGHDVRVARREVSRVLGVQLQGAALHARVRVREQLEYLAAVHDVSEQPAQISRMLGLDPIVDRFYGSLSGGMQRRVLVAMAFVGSPQLAVLDEPTSGVDVESRNEIWTALRNLLVARGAGVLVTTHDLTEAERHADRVIVMRRGQIIADGPPAKLVVGSGLSSVVTVRSSGGVDPGLPDGIGGRVVVLRVSPFEVTLGFTSRSDVGAYRGWIERENPDVVLVERSPVFEDAYLVMAASDDKGKVADDER